jgi:hypothetical protein
MKKIILLVILLLALPLQSMASANALEIIIDNSSKIDYLKTDVQPVIQNNRTFVPVRAIGEFLKLKVDFQAESNRVMMDGDGKTIALTIGDSSAWVNGKEVPLDAPPVIIQNRTMVPLRFISEALDYQVYYYDKYLDGRKMIWITKYNLIPIEESLQLPSFLSDNPYPFKKIDPNLPIYQLEPKGETPRHVRLGDSLEKVKDIYGIPYSKVIDDSSGSGTLNYVELLNVNSESGLLEFNFTKGILQKVVYYR